MNFTILFLFMLLTLFAVFGCLRLHLVAQGASSTFLAFDLTPSFAQIAHLLAASEAFVCFGFLSTFPFILLGDNQP